MWDSRSRRRWVAVGLMVLLNAIGLLALRRTPAYAACNITLDKIEPGHGCPDCVKFIIKNDAGSAVSISGLAQIMWVGSGRQLDRIEFPSTYDPKIVWSGSASSPATNLTFVHSVLIGSGNKVDMFLRWSPGSGSPPPGPFFIRFNTDQGTCDISTGNFPPTANDDSYSVDEDSTLTVAAPGVLGNDSDVNGDTLSAALATSPAHGSATVNANGSFTYTPAADYNGPDSFTYTASDGHGGSDTAIVSITVNAVNDPPVAINNSYSVDEDNTLTVAAPGVLGNDSDVDGDALSAALATAPAHGSATVNANGSFTYTPAADYNGPDSFTYTASDGHGGSDTATVSITVNAVNDPPVAINNSYSVDEDGTLTVAAPGVLGNDSDVDGDALSAALATSPTHGSATVNANGSFTYTPAANYNGPDSFTYTASDGHGGSDTATVSITVNAVNDPPVATNNSYSVDEDNTLTVAAPGVLGNDSDVDGDTLSAALATAPAHGSATVNANGSFTYTPAANYNGPDSFTYTASDGHGGSDTATVSITVNAVADPPTANNDSYSVDEDSTLTVAAPGVLGNDSDVDGDALSAALATSPTHGSATVNANGSFTYTPAANYNGPDSFTYTASDGHGGSDTATVSITVNAVNDPPVATKDSASTAYRTAVTIPVTDNDSDVDGNLDETTLSITTPPLHGSASVGPPLGSITYTPGAGFSGTDALVYQVCDTDGLCDTAAVKITVGARPPSGGGDDIQTPARTPVPSPAAASPTPVTVPLQPSLPPAPATTPVPARAPVVTGTPTPTIPPTRAPTLSPTPVVEPSLAVTITADRAEAVGGERVVFTITVHNVTDSRVEGVRVTSTLSQSGVFAGIKVSDGMVNVLGGGIEWRLEALGPQQTASLLVDVVVIGGDEDHPLTGCVAASTTGTGEVTACERVLLSGETVAASAAGAGGEDQNEYGLAGPTPPAPDSSSPDIQAGPSGLRYRGWKCLQVFGITITCLPVVRWLLLLAGLALVGWRAWVLLRQRDQDREPPAEDLDANLPD